MIALETSPEEMEVLIQLLRTAQAKLEIEILHTDHLEFKQMLKRRKELVTNILERVAASRKLTSKQA